MPITSPGHRHDIMGRMATKAVRRDRDDLYTLPGAIALLLLCVMLWALSHLYRGIFHDASLYTLQALARLHPGSLSQDVFLRLGSQDRYTIFSSIFAAASMGLGPENAAAWLTFASQLVLLAAAFSLARAVLPSPLALLAVGVLLAIPGDYGAYRIFTCIEQFLTPRMAAEALVLAAIAAALSARHLAAALFILLSLLVHPIMASAGIAVGVCLCWVIPRPRLSATVLAAAAATFVCLGAFAPAAVGGRFDAEWLQLVRERSPYLFLTNWQLDDWGRVATTLSTLAIGSAAGSARALCQATLLTTLGGFALAFIAGDSLHLVLFLQWQPWRWEWLGTVAAALMLPMIIPACWSKDLPGRAAALLLASAWIFGATAFALMAPLAPGVLLLGRRLARGEARLILGGACAMLAIAVAWRVATNFQFTDAHYLDLAIPLWMRRAVSFTRDGSLALALIGFTGWLAYRPRGRVGCAAIAVLAGLACVAVLRPAWAQWTVRDFPPQRVAQFATWRERIPPGTDVFWPDSPLAAWLLLDRPNYLSATQTSGMVFSRNAALELERRARQLQSVVPPQKFLGWDSAAPGLGLSTPQLQALCSLAVFDFLVTGADLGFAPLDVVAGNSAHKPALRLYRCQARAAAAAT
jgi:hypothetical protein